MKVTQGDPGQLLRNFRDDGKEETRKVQLHTVTLENAASHPGKYAPNRHPGNYAHSLSSRKARSAYPGSPKQPDYRETTYYATKSNQGDPGQLLRNFRDDGSGESPGNCCATSGMTGRENRKIRSIYLAPSDILAA